MGYYVQNNVPVRLFILMKYWIPAFAGMTKNKTEAEWIKPVLSRQPVHPSTSSGRTVEGRSESTF
jgi:hypothetical protein